MATFLAMIIVSSIGFLVSSVGVQAIDTRRISRICNGDMFKMWELEQDLPRLLVDEIVDKTPDAELHEFYVNETYHQHGPMYGHGSCFEGLSRDDCQQCMYSARDQLFDECSKLSKGAQILLYDCRIRYEQAPFPDDG